MFREKYIRDNDLIKPDDDFLKRLKDSVVQEEKVVHIGNFVDYENTEQFEQLGNGQDVQEHVSLEQRKGVRWQRVIAVAACFAVVLVAAFVAGRDNMFGEENIQADMGSLISEELAEADQMVSEVDAMSVELYNRVSDLFENSNAVIYEIEVYQQGEIGMEYMLETRDQWRKLEVKEREDIISDIVSDRYVLIDIPKDADSITYYMAEFENQSYVVFGICEGQHIYIAAVSGMQSMTANE